MVQPQKPKKDTNLSSNIAGELKADTGSGSESESPLTVVELDEMARAAKEAYRQGKTRKFPA